MNHKAASLDYKYENTEDYSGASGDFRLLKLVAEGNEEAFVRFYQRFAGTIFNYLFRLVHEKEVAEDILQEVFLAAWTGARRFRGQSQVKTWLFHIAHNQAVSWFRRHHQEVDLDSIEVGYSADPEGYLLESLQKDTFRKALDLLSIEHREVIELTFYYEFSYNEIAEIVGCPVGTVKSRMSYARKQLSSLLRKSVSNENVDDGL